MDSVGKKLLIVTQKDKFYSLISIGDLQRAIIKNVPMDTKIKNILRRNIYVADDNEDTNAIKKRMLESRVEFMPIIDSEKNIINILFWEDVFSSGQKRIIKKINLPVVIMAGGKGTRLKPLTNVLPKALIPIGEKTMIEEIVDRFGNHDCSDFYISVNYKSEFIEFYIDNQKLPYNFMFFKEKKPLGTAGSLTLLKNKIHQTFFVSNCDILIEQDYSEILDYHRANHNEITIVAALKHYPIPYGTIQTGTNGSLTNLIEKPEITFKINSGMYILEPNLLNEIPDNEFFHITQLIEKVKNQKGKVGVFPVSENSWKDIGNWDEYLTTAKINKFG
ncbi:MAG: nucleotidyltransferase family protein [Bacteroidetes bacterium]|nr:nucleotidyltransferase family protein [Bacteroidota bacterium]